MEAPVFAVGMKTGKELGRETRPRRRFVEILKASTEGFIKTGNGPVTE